MANKQKKGNGRSQKGIRAVPVNRMVNQGCMTNTVMSAGPRIRSAAGGQGLVIKNQEAIAYAATNTSSTTGDRKAYFGLTPAAMSWLGGVAQNFQYYRWKKLSVLYSSRVPTTNSSIITMGVFTDSADVSGWYTGAGNAIELTYLPRSATGPSWSSAIHTRGKNQIYSDLMVEVDVRQAHMRTPWYIFDVNPTTDVSANQACPAFLAHVVGPSGTLDQQVGIIMIDYEIELLNPTPAVRNTLSKEGGFPLRASKDVDHVPHRFPGETDITDVSFIDQKTV